MALIYILLGIIAVGVLLVELERGGINMIKYKVRVEDKFHQTSSEYRDSCHYILGEYNTKEEALRACKDFLDRDFKDIVKDYKDKEDFYNYWAFHGERLYIFPEIKGYKSFSSDEYIDKKIEEHFKN